MTFGLGSTDQLEPFQFSIKALSWNPLPPPPPKVPYEPTAQHAEALTHEMLLKMAPPEVSRGSGHRRGDVGPG